MTGPGGSSHVQSAAPASGKYGGFGSKDIEQFGYNNPSKFGQPYDPYVSKTAPVPTTSVKGSTATTTTTSSATTKTSETVKKSVRKRNQSSEESSSGDSSSEDSDDSENEKKKKKDKKKKQNGGGLAQPNKAERTI
jgi:hypothetical protein